MVGGGQAGTGAGRHLLAEHGALPDQLGLRLLLLELALTHLAGETGHRARSSRRRGTEGRAGLAHTPLWRQINRLIAVG